MQTHKHIWKLFDIEYSSVKSWELEWENRLDSEYYGVSFIKTQQKILKNNPSPLWRYVDDWYRVVYENTKILSSYDEKKYKNVWFLQATNINWIFLQENIWRVVYDDWIRYQKWRIKKWELLIEVKWNTEKLAIVPNDYPEDVLVSGTLFKMSLKDIVPEYVLVYLLTNYWQASKQKLQSNIAVSYINKDSLYSILIPQTSEKFQLKIKDLIKEVFFQNELSEKLYQEAQHLLLSELNLVDYQTKTKTITLQWWVEMQILENHATINYKTLQELDRFDAEYWDYSYFEIIEKIKNYPWWYDNLSNLVKLSKKKITLDEEKTYNYIELADINKSNGMVENITEIIGKDLPSRARMKIEKWSVLFSSLEWSIDKVAIVNSDLLDLVASTWFFIFQEDILNKETLLVLLKIFWQNYIAREALGTIMSAISNNGIERILFPKINIEVQKIITEKIQQSFLAKQQSQHLLELAKKAVEIYIEQDEEQGLEYIKTNQIK